MNVDLRFVDDDVLTAELDRRGYVVAKPGEEPPPPREYTIHEKLRNRMETIASDLAIIDGMTKAGGILDPAYTNTYLRALRRYAERVFDALAERRAVVNEWDRSEGRGLKMAEMMQWMARRDARMRRERTQRAFVRLGLLALAMGTALLIAVL